MAAVNGMQSQGWGRRAIGALVLLLAISFGANLIYAWLAPLLPLLIVLLILLVLFGVVLGRFRG